MKKAKFGFIQGRMTITPSKKILQYFPKKNWRKEFYYAKKNNFNFIEYFGERKFNKENPIWSKKKLNEINKLDKKNNLLNYSFCDDYFIGKKITKYKNLNKYYNEIVKNLSIINIKVYVLALFEKSLIDKKNLNNFIKILQTVSEKLKYKKIKLAIECNLEAESIKKLATMVNRENFYIVYDTGNRLKKQNLQYKEILNLKKYICHIHLKDKNWKGHNVILGTGAVNFQSIFKAIKKIKYDGNFTFETNRGNNPIKTMCENKSFISNLIQKL